jgi:hypothetical protein
MVRSQPRQIVCETLSKILITKRAGGVAQDEGPEFKPQYCKKKEKVKDKLGLHLATQEVEIKRIMVRNQPRQIVQETHLKNSQYKKGLVECLK